MLKWYLIWYLIRYHLAEAHEKTLWGFDQQSLRIDNIMLINCLLRWYDAGISSMVQMNTFNSPKITLSEHSLVIGRCWDSNQSWKSNTNLLFGHWLMLLTTLKIDQSEHNKWVILGNFRVLLGARKVFGALFLMLIIIISNLSVCKGNNRMKMKY